MEGNTKEVALTPESLLRKTAKTIILRSFGPNEKLQALAEICMDTNLSIAQVMQALEESGTNMAVIRAKQELELLKYFGTSEFAKAQALHEFAQTGTLSLADCVTLSWCISPSHATLQSALAEVESKYHSFDLTRHPNPAPNGKEILKQAVESIFARIEELRQEAA